MAVQKYGCPHSPGHLFECIEVQERLEVSQNSYPRYNALVLALTGTELGVCVTDHKANLSVVCDPQNHDTGNLNPPPVW